MDGFLLTGRCVGGSADCLHGPCGRVRRVLIRGDTWVSWPGALSLR